MPVSMEAEQEERGGRWTSFTPHEHDLRTQKHGRDYESCPDSRQPRPPRPPGNSADGNQTPRGPNVKTLIANQQGPGRRKTKSTAVAHHVIRKEGPNWVLLAGGALVTAIGVMIVRKRRPSVCEEKIIEKAVPTPGRDHVQLSSLSFVAARRESTGSRASEPSTDSPFSGDAYMITHNVARSQSDGSRVGSDWGEEDCIPPSPDCVPLSPPGQYEYNFQHTQFSKGSNHSGRTVITPTSPPGSYRETSATEGNDMPLSPVNRSGYSSRRDMVHRLRQQLKSRDETIHEMVAQIQDQDRTISLHQAHCRDLEGRLDIATRTLFESEREIQRLRMAVADYLRGHSGSGEWDLPPLPDAGSHEEDSDYPENTINVFLSDHHESGQDVKTLLLEVKRLTEELKIKENQKRKIEGIANEKLIEHEILKERLEQLEEELEEANRKVFEKDLLLEAFETHQDYQADAVDAIKRKLEGNQTPSLIGRKSLSGGHGSIFSKQASKGKREETVSSKADTSIFPAGTVVRTNSVLFERNSDQSPSKGNSGKGWFKTDESSSPGDASEDSDVEISSPAVGHKLLMKLQEEVESLSVALADHSQMIAEKRMETSRLVDELQRHNAVISDLQLKMEENGEEKSELEEQDWEKLSGVLSFSNGGTSAAQVQELSHKLEQIATQQRVEEEMAELAKHQVKIRELKDRVEKLLSKFKNMQDESASGDPAIHEQASHMIALGLELSRTLFLQEEQAKKTSKEVARLSANFKLSSPYVPRSEKEALRKKLQGSSSESLSPGMETGSLVPINLSKMLAAVQARFSTGSEEKPKESGDSLFDRTISVSSAELTRPQSEGGLASQMQEQYVYRPGFSGPSNRKSRRGFPIGSGSGKEPVVGGKRRASRSTRKGSSSEEREVVRSDSNRWTNKPKFQLASADANRILFHSYSESSARQKLFGAEQDVSSPDVRRSEFGDWMKEQTAELSAAESMEVGDVQPGRQDSPKSRRQSACSFYSVEDSTLMRMGSPTVAEGHREFSPETSMESTKGSFGKFIFDMEKGNEVYVINPDDGVQEGSQGNEASPLVPVTQLMADLDLKPASPETSAQEDCSFGSNISGLSTEILNALRESPRGSRGEKSSGSYSECSNSLDSSLDGMLDNALDDMVRLVSIPSSPAETPESSFTSSY